MAQRDYPQRGTRAGCHSTGDRLLVVAGERLFVPQEEDVEDGFADRANTAEELESAGIAEVGELELLQLGRVGERKGKSPDRDVWRLVAVEAEELK